MSTNKDRIDEQFYSSAAATNYSSASNLNYIIYGRNNKAIEDAKTNILNVFKETKCHQILGGKTYAETIQHLHKKEVSDIISITQFFAFFLTTSFYKYSIDNFCHAIEIQIS